MEQLKLNGTLISLAEHKEDATKIEAKFLVCPLDVGNENKAGLREKDLTDEEKKGLIGEPLVCKIVKNHNGEYDFSGHNYKKIRELDSKGKLISKTDFDTYPIGYHTNIEIEEIELDGVVKRCFVATAHIWKRYWRAIEVIERLGTALRTSWEISYNNFYIDKGVKWLTDITWLGNCCLGENVQPAYGSAGLLEVAEQDVNLQLAMAFTEDVQENKTLKKEEEKMKSKELEKDKTNNSDVEEKDLDNEKQPEDVEEKQETSETEDKEKISEDEQKKENNSDETDKDEEVEKSNLEASALTTRDIHRGIERALDEYEEEWYHIVRVYPLENRFIACREWSRETEDSMCEYIYTIADDGVVTITSKRDVKMVFVAKELVDEQATELSEKQAKIIELSETIVSQDTLIAEKDNVIKEKLNIIAEKETIIAELEPFKSQVEEIEKEKREAELSQAREDLKTYALSSNYITAEDIETSEVLQEAIDTLNKDAIKIFIAEKVIKKAEFIKKENIEASEKMTITKDLASDIEYSYENEDPISNWLKGK